MNLKLISRYVGYALLVSALFMLISSLVSFLNDDGALAPLLVSALITFLVGVFPFIFVKGNAALSLKDGYMIIVLSWLLSFVFGMLPYALWGGPFSLANAWFESVSGFTTTGATILEDVESLPKGLLFWRSATHFIGGLGVVVFLLLVIPNASPVKLRLTNMELSSLSKSGYSSRVNKTVNIFAYVYLGIALISFVSYWLAGMTPFDALCHSFSVSATGGFSTRNLSIAAFDSRLVEFLTMVFMLVASLHFGLLYLSIVHRSLKPLNNPVTKFYLIFLLSVSLILGFVLKIQGNEAGWFEAFWHSSFQTLCVASTTGFGITDNAHWGMLPFVILMFAGVMCGCAGSTTGGLKADRVLVLFKTIGRQIGRIIHPSSVNEVRLGRRVLRDEEVAPHILFVALYCLILSISVVLALSFGVRPASAFSASVASLGNVGPAAFELGNFGNYNALPASAKLLFSLDMFLGRIEIFPFLAIVALIFEKKRR